MALIDCPSCNKKISDKADDCPHCGFSLADASSEDILRKQKLKRFYLPKRTLRRTSLLQADLNLGEENDL